MGAECAGLGASGSAVHVLSAADQLLIAEDAQAYVAAGPSLERDDTGDVVLFHRPFPDPRAAGACRIRFETSGADRRIDEVRAWMTCRRSGFTWWLGASSTPSDLAERLRSRGAMPDPRDRLLTPMILSDEPPLAPRGVEVRAITSLDEYRRAREMTWAFYGVASDERNALSDRLAEEWEWARADHSFRFGAWIGGQLAAWALLQPLTVGPPCLARTSTLSWRAPRAACQALMRACWDAGVGLGTSGLVAQAGEHAKPLLEHLGFRAGDPIRLLFDAGLPGDGDPGGRSHAQPVRAEPARHRAGGSPGLIETDGTSVSAQDQRDGQSDAMWRREAWEGAR